MAASTDTLEPKRLLAEQAGWLAGRPACIWHGMAR